MNNPTTATAPASKRTMTTKALAYCALLAALRCWHGSSSPCPM